MDDGAFENCERGNEFWWGQENKEAHHFMSYKKGFKDYVLEEKIVQGEISTFYLDTLQEIQEQLGELTPNKVIWIHNLKFPVLKSRISSLTSRHQSHTFP